MLLKTNIELRATHAGVLMPAVVHQQCSCCAATAKKRRVQTRGASNHASGSAPRIASSLSTITKAYAKKPSMMPVPQTKMLQMTFMQ